MAKKGQKFTPEHRNKLSIRAKLRGNNGWLGRKHRPESIKKMSRRKSTEHKARIGQSMLLYWKEKNKKEGWVVEKKEVREPVAPQTYEPYQDIYMEGWEGIKDVL